MLVIVEPRIVNPAQYTKSVRENFGLVIPLSKRYLMSRVGEAWDDGHLPTLEIVKDRVKEAGESNRRLGSVGMINQNKVSLVPGALYAKRRDVIKEFIDSRLTFDLAGANWDKGYFWLGTQYGYAAACCFKAQTVPRIASIRAPIDIKNKHLRYHGWVESQFNFMKGLQFVVVIENEASYVSEKILNAIVAGCIPLYLGPPLREFGIPDGVAIQVNGLKGQFSAAFNNASRKQIAEVLEIGRQWITSDDTLSRWGVRQGFNRLAERISRFIDETAVTE